MEFSKILEMLESVGIVTAVIGGIGTLVFQAVKLVGRVDHLEVRMNNLEGRMDRLEKKVDEILSFLSQNFKRRKKKKVKSL
jgi:hypothetical protein